MKKSLKENCIDNIENDIHKEEYLDFSDDFIFCSNYKKFSPYYKEGYLEKKCSNSWCGYKKRWFLLKNKKLYYFKNKESFRPSGVLDLDLINMNINYENGLNRKKRLDDCFIYCIESRKNKDESFLILNPKNTYINFYLKGEDKEIIEWYNLLNSSIDNKKILNQPKFIFSENNFWKIDRISVEVFEAIADTGDIILFRSNVISGKLQRILTGGDYDHIGMILRNDKNDLFLLEAISNMGIILTPWTLFVKNKWNEAYSRISLRRLTWNNSEENLQKLLDFLKNTVGKKYNLKIVNFLVSKNDDNNGYFCSELIGECWKIMGVIPLNTSCSNILPSNFSEKFEEKIKLHSGCQLNNELCIDFSL
ncbi:conserved Plasmodium protein, unknown function [Plasmodium gallinaceum]|uniref:PH domain-containing protein n=1 Tax=Plasmodium gallinaceum TaxID=5849 RepID=A0A1J1GSE5_PLAGA|nr:conserved Plasmodium protein, unknown function [Plasmodium gallinaceum]CRG93971.1 conserved Plasmodium protein, unknown function [Plasmodium gallinaceum]